MRQPGEDPRQSGPGGLKRLQRNDRLSRIGHAGNIITQQNSAARFFHHHYGHDDGSEQQLRQARPPAAATPNHDHWGPTGGCKWTPAAPCRVRKLLKQEQIRSGTTHRKFAIKYSRSLWTPGSSGPSKRMPIWWAVPAKAMPRKNKLLAVCQTFLNYTIFTNRISSSCFFVIFVV